MHLKFEGEVADLMEGIELLGCKLGFVAAEDGIPVKVKQSSGNIEVCFRDGKGIIIFDRKIHFYRALGLLVEGLTSGHDFCITETPQFTMNGPLFDVSRNAVLKVDSIKKLLLNMAVMGLDMMMLYAEDVYTIEGEPYFGYMRGRYTNEELKECDDFANHFGIEIIPCIQTLAHLEQFLKWNAVEKLRDTREVLFTGSEETYKFIDKMIHAAAAPFRSKRIHLGMDEAYGLGRGRYLDINGYKSGFEIISEHLNKVLAITKKYGLKPMIWSDTYFNLISNKDFSEEKKTASLEMSKDLQFVYWDYYKHCEEDYIMQIKKHKELGSTPVFAGGIWTWNGIGTNYGRSILDTNAALIACKKESVSEVIATIWGDDGNENNYFSALFGLQLFAEHGYSSIIEMDNIKKRFKFCTGADPEAFIDLGYLDETPGSTPDNRDSSNPSKLLLWQDILIGLFDRHIEGLDMAGHYAELESRIKKHREADNDWAFVYNVPEKLCSVLKLKCDIGIRIKKAYDDKNIEYLKQIAKEELRELAMEVNALRAAHRMQWMMINKPFGWEVLDIRYGGLLARIDTAIYRLTDFVEGSMSQIEELEEERLYFDGIERPNKDYGVGWSSQYHRIASAGYFFHALPL